jgi:signal transduction histidine kinase
MSETAVTPPPPPAQAPPPAPRAHILVAEDNSDLRRFLQDLLALHYKVEAVADGRAALEAVRRQPPDLLLCDVMMPHLSGTELCHKLKADPQTQGLPIILLTARGSIEETLEGFAQGADDYLVKPFNPQELLVRVSVQLKLRRLSAQVAQHARLAAVGTLAAGVAHEIKNPLNAIHTGVAALRRKPDSPGRGELFDLLDECVGRIAEIATALTDHARPADGEGLSPCDLKVGLESTLRLLAERLREHGVQVVREYRTNQKVLGRPRQLNQVFLNLLDNALRASPQGGRIFLTVMDEGPDRVVVSVRDEGPGIGRDVRERIFDPFFTTRPPGEGTGLGLYLSRQIIDAHGGTLRVISEAGQGAEFRVELPVKLAHSQGQGMAA